MDLLTPLLALLAAAAAGHAPGPTDVSVVETTPAIVRQTPHGDERLVYLSIGNAWAETLTGLSLVYELDGKEQTREILDIPPGGAWDTLWLPEPPPEKVRARLLQAGQRVLWSGELDPVPGPMHGATHIPTTRPAPVVIPRSDPVKAADLKPLMLRGTNYYPRHHPWSGLWRTMDEKLFEPEFAEMAKLNANTIRTFYIHDRDGILHRKDGTFAPLMVSRIDTLLRVADRHHMKVMICLRGGGDAPESDLVFWRRYLRTGVEPFAYDGRVLMWDLVNEPGGAAGPKANADLSRWLQEMHPELRRRAPHHLHTVGLCWQFDQLWDLGVKPPVGQYHNYSGAVGVQPEGKPPVRNVADDLRKTAKFIDNRPLIIGEFGYASVVDDQRKDASEERQREITEGVLAGSEAAVATGVNLSGVYNWCAFHFAPAWMGKGEQSFGVINLDGTLKPAGALLRDTYARWRTRVPAPWEVPDASR